MLDVPAWHAAKPGSVFQDAAKAAGGEATEFDRSLAAQQAAADKKIAAILADESLSEEEQAHISFLHTRKRIDETRTHKYIAFLPRRSYQTLISLTLINFVF